MLKLIAETIFFYAAGNILKGMRQDIQNLDKKLERLEVRQALLECQRMTPPYIPHIERIFVQPTTGGCGVCGKVGCYDTHVVC